MRAAWLIVSVLVTAAAGCGGRAPSGPAWPKSAGTEIDPDAEDGGESLAPRESKAAVASVEASETAAPKPDGDKPSDEKTDATPEKTPDPAVPAPATSTEEPPVLEEIVIEVSD